MKTVTVLCNLRDENGDIIGNSDAQGTTEDEGITCILPIGYLPALATALPGDVTLTVHQPAVIYPDVEVVSVVADEENLIQTVVFELPE